MAKNPFMNGMHERLHYLKEDSLRRGLVAKILARRKDVHRRLEFA